MKNYLFGILIIALFSVACEKKENNIGLELQPEGENLGLAMDSSVVHMKTVRQDSLSTTNLTTAILGHFFDPVFGETKSIIYIQPKLSNSDVTFGDGATLDSLVLSLAYAEDYYGVLEDIQINVHPLSEVFSQDSTYYNYSQLAYAEDSILADPEILYNIAPDEDVVVGDQTVGSHLRIRLENGNWDLGTELLDPANEANLNSTTDFNNYLKGLRIEALNPNLSDGGLYYFDLFSDLTIMTLYYHTNENDSLSYDFPITVTSPKYTEFQHEYAPTEIQAQLDDMSNPDSWSFEEVYLQSTLGLGIEVNLPNLFDLTDNQNIVINRAYLEMPITSDVEAFAPIPRIKGIRFEDGNQSDIPDAALDSWGAAYTDGYYDAENSLYRLTVTRFVQQVLNNQIEDPTFVIVPDLSRTIANRSIISSPNGPDGNRTKLIINYTIY